MNVTWRNKYLRQLIGLLLFIPVLLLWSPGASASNETKMTMALLDAAYKSGMIDTPSYVIQKLHVYFPDEMAAKKMTRTAVEAPCVQCTPTRDLTPLLVLAKQNWKSYSADDQAFLARVFARPSPFEATYETTHFKFWYDKTGGHKVPAGDTDGNGTPDYVENMGAVFENVYTTEVTTLGYDAPPKDPGDAAHGGDDKFDIYIYQLCPYTDGSCLYGFAVPEGAATGGDANEKYAYMAMDNDYVGFSSGTVLQNTQVTAAHEFHHAIQFGINADADAWYMEATSTWMEDQVYDGVDDNRQYLNGTGVNDFFYHPETSLDTATDHWYGTWIWNEFMKTKWNQAAIKSVWTKLDPVGHNTAVDEIANVLTEKSTTLKKAFTEFVTKNYVKKGFYKDAVFYDPVKLVNKAAPHTLDYSSDTSYKVDSQTVNVNHLASKYYKFVPGISLRKPTMLIISVDGVDNKDVNAVAIVKKKNGSFVEYPFNLDGATNKGEIGIPGFSSQSVTEVVLALSNDTKADDNLEIKYEAQLMKAFTFVVDDTGSMSTAIYNARAAANRVLDANKAAGIKRFYTLISFKDGPGTLRGQSSDEDVMKGYVATLSANGGNGCPESSLTAIRKAADLAEGSDIMMMTDADSNSYGVDNTYATWGEVAETIFKLLETKSRLHSIIYSDCYGYYRGKTNNDGSSATEAAPCKDCNDTALSAAMARASGIEGYNRISTETGGLYFRVSPSDTESAAEMILRASTTNATIAYYDGSAPGEGFNTYAVPVDASVEFFQVILNGDSGSSVTLEVSNPGGTVVNAGTDGVTVNTIGSTTQYIIEGSAFATGEWTAKVSGTGTYRFTVEAETTNPMDYTGATSVGIGNMLDLQANVWSPVSGIAFEIVNLDGSNFADVVMNTSDDLDFTGSHLMSTVGSYRFKATGSGFFQRMDPATITVGNLDVMAPDPVNATPGTTLVHTFTIENLGTVEDTYDLFATSSMGWADISAVNGSSITIAEGGTQTIDITVNVPAGASTGDVDILSVQAISQSDTLVNDTDQTETRVTPIYDFNEDGAVNETDIDLIVAFWNTLSGADGYDPTYDVDGNGVINVVDIMLVASQYGWSSSSRTAGY